MRWHKSLYWRIAIGFVLFLAAMLVVQAMLFVWVVARSGRTVPGQSPGRFSETVALDLANALGREPDLDVARYVREQYGQNTHPFFVMLADGGLITSGSNSFPEALLRMARARLQRRLDRPEGGPFGRGLRPGPRSDEADPAGPRYELGGRGDPRLENHRRLAGVRGARVPTEAPAFASSGRRRSPSTVASPESSSFRPMRRSPSCSAGSRRCSRQSLAAC